jgi:hypothetical protein
MSKCYFVELRDMAEGQEPYWAESSAEESYQLPPSYHIYGGYRYWGVAKNPGEAMRNARRKRRADSGVDDDE